jgi:prepilin-type N-terminal cleavage/methylation domain-containing protein
MRRARGFTLLEVVVALAITATIIVVLQRTTADALRARARLETDVERRGALRATLVHLVREVGAAVPGTLRIQRTPAVPAPLLEFAVDEPSPVVVRYRLAERRLERSERPRYALDDEAQPATVLLPDVAGLDVRGRDAQGWHETWEESHPPQVVALALELASGERLATLVPLVAGARP